MRMKDVLAIDPETVRYQAFCDGQWHSAVANGRDENAGTTYMYIGKGKRDVTATSEHLKQLVELDPSAKDFVIGVGIDEESMNGTTQRRSPSPIGKVVFDHTQLGLWAILPEGAAGRKNYGKK